MKNPWEGSWPGGHWGRQTEELNRDPSSAVCATLAGELTLLGTTLPAGTTLPVVAMLPAGAMLPVGTMLPAGPTLPAEAMLPVGTMLPAETTLPVGTMLPVGTTLPVGSAMLPVVATLLAGTTLPVGTEIPAGTSLPVAGVLLGPQPHRMTACHRKSAAALVLAAGQRSPGPELDCRQAGRKRPWGGSARHWQCLFAWASAGGGPAYPTPCLHRGLMPLEGHRWSLAPVSASGHSHCWAPCWRWTCWQWTADCKSTAGSGMEQQWSMSRWAEIPWTGGGEICSGRHWKTESTVQTRCGCLRYRGWRLGTTTASNAPTTVTPLPPSHLLPFQQLRPEQISLLPDDGRSQLNKCLPLL